MIPSFILQELLSGVTMGAIYVAIALGLTIVYGILKVLHIAHAGVYMVGAYIGYMTFLYTENVAAALLAGSLGAMVMGVLIERAFYLPMLDKPRHIPLMISIALFILIEELGANIFGHHPKGFHINIPLISYEVGGVVVTSHQLLVLVLVYSVTAALWLFINKSKIGLASRALIQDQEIAQSMGVNVVRIVDVNFALGSALAGLGGVLVGMYYASISPFMGDMVAYKGLVVIVLGGFGSISGAVLGGLILGISEAFLTAHFGHILPREAFAFIIMTVLLIFRPQGLLGRAE